MIKMRVEGGDQLAARLRTLSTAASKSMLKDALRTTAAMPIQSRASAMAPVRPGAPDLADHVVIANGQNRGNTVALLVGPPKDVRSDQASRTFDMQAIYVEYGTNDTAPQPFLRPAFDEHAPRAIGAFAGEVWSAIARKFGGSRGGSTGGGLL